MKKKTVNELYAQLVAAHNKHGGLRLIFAYRRAFVQHFGVYPHTKECKSLLDKYGRDYPM